MPDDPTPPTPDAEPSAAAPPTDPAAAMADDALKAAQDAVAALSAETSDSSDAAPAGIPASATEPVPAPDGPAPQPFALPDLASDSSPDVPAGVSLLSDVNLNVKIELGRTMMLVEDVLRLAEGAVVELDKLAGDPVDIYVNDRHIARGEVLVLNDNFCVRISEILAPAKIQEPIAAEAAA